MKRRNAILAAVIGIVMVAAAAGGVILMNPGSNTANAGNDGSSDVGATGQPGAVVATEVSSATINASLASPLAELAAEFNATPNSLGAPDFLMKVAVTNSMEGNLSLNGSGFTAMLADGNSSQAVGNMSMTVGPNTTVFPVIGFMTNGTNVQSVNYSDGSLNFSVNRTFQDTDGGIPGMVLSSGPEGNTTEVRNLTFQNLAVWNIFKGGFAPMPLRFNDTGNGSVVLALMTATNHNTTNFSLAASQFWLDVGNGTWVQGDMGANNIPSQLENNTTVPFLIGFRVAENMTVNGSVYFWPNQGQFLAQIPLNMTDGGNATSSLVLKSIRHGNMTGDNKTAGGNASDGAGANWIANKTGNGTSNASISQQIIELMAIGDNVTASNVSDMMVWTLRNGSMSVSPQASTDNRSLNLTVDLEQGDEVMMLSFSINGETKYVWMRPLAHQA